MSGRASPTWLALGDSYTIGEAVPLHLRWPHQLTRQLGFCNPQYVATTGWTTRDLLDAITEAIFTPPYTWVSLLIGVNNQYQGLDFSLYRPEFTELLEFAIAQTTNARHVLVLSIPDYSVTSFAQDKDPAKIQREIEQYNQVNRQIAEEYGVRYCDITPISQQATDDPSLIADDGLHPSGKMYQLWGEKVKNTVRF
ncbi:SGNH/GDSL hydrolase family protein [Tunicatimonas pelagia]|uniref:SGNH/GDSL hydrolase family protein n=1 Tax=Tunicatimonas pelagia TaxID=931531 RepID=UPI0026658FA6|nr:SGNH/GDSL hydrolase family protein [Tunicatimonas pelagia]WKN43988.1 SGNH/GDSL hydrolase family protein [Tunicatimonas pelagia]